MLIGCIFCHYVHTAKGTLNTHLNRFVPEMAAARGERLEEDSHHHVGMIRELRWVERGRLERKITWKLSSDGDERVVLQAFSGLIYHPVQEYAKDDFKCRQFRNVDTSFWRRRIRATLAEYRLQPLSTRRWFLESAVQDTLARALSLSQMRVPIAPSVRLLSNDGDNSGTAIGVGRDAMQNNRIGGSFNKVMAQYAEARKKPAPMESSESSAAESDDDDDDETSEPKHRKPGKPPTRRYSKRDVSEEDDEPRMPAGRKRRAAPAIPESPETPPAETRKNATGNAKPATIVSSMRTRGNRGRVTHEQPANTMRSPSVFASPSRGRTRPSYTSIAEWNTPVKSSHVKRIQRPLYVDSDDPESDTPQPLAKEFRPRLNIPQQAVQRQNPTNMEHARKTTTPGRVPTSTIVVSPAIEPLLKLTITVFGCHKARLRIYPGIELPVVIERAFADAPKDIVGLSLASGIRGTGAGPVAGWKRVWDEQMWCVVLDAARECARAPEWRAEAVFLGK